jgi:voltage-gated potassium channel
VAFEGLENIERRHLWLTGVRALVTVGIVVGAYAFAPLNEHPHTSIWLRLFVALLFFIVALGYEVRAILRSERPFLRATDAMSLVIPLFLVLFAWTYLTMSLSAPDSFSMHLDRISALYFAVTVFSTVGFGDITAKTDAARLVVTVQMLADLVVIAFVVRLIFGAARGMFNREPAET